ncbi:MAG: N-formylglutamate amidohydrolase [Candidatus Kerfeldbacteria bacterium]|nr:N-formylglutamate amidohydrolase [Candidatus Kerfeldbacteria bacterium]
MIHKAHAPYFSFTRGETPVFLHIPHSSVRIPEEWKSDFVISSEALAHEAQWMGDLYTDELFFNTSRKYYTLTSQISRLVVDVERFEDDAKEGMSAYGMGAVYEKTSNGAWMKSFSAQRREEYLHTIFRPYHAALNALIQDCIDRFGYCFIIDCHSFPSEPRYYEDQTPNRPDICLGTTKGYAPEFTPDWSIELCTTYFSSQNYSVKLDTPFSGTILPNDLVKQEAYKGKMHSIMLEINRKLYMDEHEFTKKASFHTLQNQIQNCLAQIEDRVKEKTGTN